MPEAIFECVINVSEGRDMTTIASLAREGAPTTIDVHTDADHHRSVLTLAGRRDVLEAAVRRVAAAAVAHIDIRAHSGAHPRLGAVDVVPFVDLSELAGRPTHGDDSIGLRDSFARWTSETLDLPCFLYGNERSLPEVRRNAWQTLDPDVGPPRPHPSAGAAAVGSRPVLVAYNLWLKDPDLAAARRVAAEIRSPTVRTLGLAVGSHVQVSCNLIAPFVVGPGVVYDEVARRVPVERAELVGLVPWAVLHAERRTRWVQLALSEGETIEARLEKAGLDGGRFCAS